MAQLADEDFDVREKAQRALEHLSAEHLDDLKARLKGAEEIEIQIRLHAIVIRIADSLIHVAEGLLAEAREALEQGKNERASDLLCEMLSCLRRRWDELDTPGDIWMKARKPDSHDPFLALCSKLSACSDQTLWALFHLALLEDQAVLEAEEIEMQVYDVCDLSTSPNGFDVGVPQDDPIWIVCQDIFNCYAARREDVSTDFRAGRVVSMAGPSLHAVSKQVFADIRADVIQKWDQHQKEKGMQDAP